MKIMLLIGQAHGLGGTELQLVQMAKLMSERGHSTSVHVMARPGILTDLLDQEGVRWSAPAELRSLNKLQSNRAFQVRRAGTVIQRTRTALALLRSVRSVRPDIVQAFLPVCIADGIPIVSRAAPQAILVAGIRGFTPDVPATRRFQRGSLRDRMRRSLSICAATTVNSTHLIESETVPLGVPINRVHVIHSGLTIPSAKASTADSPANGVVVSNLHGYKGYDVLVDAIATMGAGAPTVRLCGEGPVRDEIRALALQRNVEHLLEFVTAPANVREELQRAQFAVHPSRTEGLSNAILEEMAAGSPVVASSVGGNPSLIDDGITGFLVPPDDSDALAQALDAIVGNPDLRRDMGNRARAKAEKFSWANCIDNHISLYSELREGASK